MAVGRQPYGAMDKSINNLNNLRFCLGKAGRDWTALEGNWRRERDSNPRYPFRHNGFQDRRYQPLTHPSAWERLTKPQFIVPLAFSAEVSVLPPAEASFPRVTFCWSRCLVCLQFALHHGCLRYRTLISGQSRSLLFRSNATSTATTA